MMYAAIAEVISKHVWAYAKPNGKCVMFLTNGVVKVADELDISYDAALELTRQWIREQKWD